MLSIFKNTNDNPKFRAAADKLFRIPHDRYDARIKATKLVINELDANAKAKAYFEDMLEKILDEKEEASSHSKNRYC